MSLHCGFQEQPQGRSWLALSNCLGRIIWVTGVVSQTNSQLREPLMMCVHNIVHNYSSQHSTVIFPFILQVVIIA